MSERRPVSELRVVLVGATGLVGRAVKERAVGLSGVRLAALARREVSLPRGARMEMYLSDPAHWAERIAALRPDGVICALGTTWRKAGQDEAAFRAVDQALVLEVAQAARQAGVRQFIAVSAVGANAMNRNRYLRVKGEMEDALARMKFTRLDILRPGLLRGRRVDDPRPAERLAMLASPLVDLLLHGSWRKYRSISARDMASAIWALSQEKAAGRFVHDYDGLRRAARKGATL